MNQGDRLPGECFSLMTMPNAPGQWRVLTADPANCWLTPSPPSDLTDAIQRLAVGTARDPHPIVLFVDEDDPAFMEEAIGAEVSSSNVLGVPPPDVKPILRAAVCRGRAPPCNMMVE